MGESHRGFPGGLLIFDIVTANGMLLRGIAFLRLGGYREPGAFPVLVTIDRDPIPGRCRGGPSSQIWPPQFTMTFRVVASRLISEPLPNLPEILSEPKNPPGDT